MHIENSLMPFDIEKETLTLWSRRPHKHNFFELVFIEEGTGKQCINGTLLPYQDESIFLLPPYDCHSFEIESETTFVFIRFNALFFKEDKRTLMDYSQWFANLHFILSSYNRIPGDIIHSDSDRAVMTSLIRSMQREKEQNSASESILRTNMVALLNLLLRNFENSFLEKHQDKDLQTRDLLQYIQYNLFDNSKLKTDIIADEFKLSPNYVGEYFKKKTGESLKEYILKARVNVAQSRIEYSGQSLKEIAYDLGFTDASHMTKVIKKYYDDAGTSCSSFA
ncbi:helix-turn-helix domain-containing protein [Flavobacterium alkalisoli]|uniref:Helix-turn-helix domain-containing protein n=1 Tax=Flavobacterium alkalisoli TaxID=2602769 RepID=A0A5B9FVB3_9FLAO|nr:helix-turn-helix domain-containing protein [Flavobacterium alkalisoli]QEE50249.1 helix-turn-helix domain-containing protein [Flavobacterium alkalisoli]